MRLAVIIRAEQKERLPTAAELRNAGFAVSSALGPESGGAGPGGASPGPDDGGGPEPGGPDGRRLPATTKTPAP
jgi:hypothetical protein